MSLRAKLLTPTASLPVRSTPYAAGYDLCASELASIAAGGRAVVKTGLSIELPSGTYGRVAPRSGLAVKNGIDVGAGVIDEDYRGEVGVVLFNFGSETFNISPGDRIAQLIITPYVACPVEKVEELSETVRGEGGFGSTGVSGKP